jgi:hypothetical protein
MATQAFLHVGTMKSATTYIQGLCDENADRLATLGVLWQGSGVNFSAVSDFYAAAEAPHHQPTVWNEFVSKIGSHDGSALISNELLAARGRRRVAALLEAFDPTPVTVIVTARDLGRVLPSQWQERARNRPMESWWDFMQRLMADDGRNDPEARWFWQRQDLNAIVAKYASVVGLDQVVVVTVPPSGSEPSLLADRFFSVLGITNRPALTVPTADNPSMGTRSVELIRRIQERLRDDQRARLRMALKHVLSRRVLAGRRPMEPAVELTSRQLGWASDIAEQSMGGLADSGVRVVGDLADLRPREAVSGIREQPTPVTDAELLDSAVEAMIGLVEVVNELARSPRSAGHAETLRLLSRRQGTVEEDDD